MLDLQKTYCLKSSPGIPFTIRGQVNETMLTPKLRKEGIEVGDYICERFVTKIKKETLFFKEHQLTVYKSQVGITILRHKY